ncbi:MAG: hypothetical protein HC794_01615 [Nitrospiraceae bacterium]|nr:hypothetical protein [Nitrospiraceae bacterium]
MLLQKVTIGNPGSIVDIMDLGFTWNTQRGLLNSRRNGAALAPGTWNESFTYDIMDRLLTFNDNNGNKSHAYDARGRITTNSAIGTYTGLRGGDRYHTLIRKTEPKPLRIFLQDGSKDLNIYGGDWWMANQTMQRALAFSGYEVRHVWGEGGHNAKHGTAVFPDAIRWLWSGWPAPVKSAAPTKNSFLAQLLIPGEDWQLVSEGHRLTEGAVANAQGEVFFTDIPNSKAYKIGLDGKVTLVRENTQRSNGQAFGPDGRLYAPPPGPSRCSPSMPPGNRRSSPEGIAGQRPRGREEQPPLRDPTAGGIEPFQRAEQGLAHPARRQDLGRGL